MTIDEYITKWEAAFIERGHKPALDDDGEPDWFALSHGFHNGPECTACGWSRCQHCVGIDDIPVCPGATLQDGGGGMSRGKDIGFIPEASSNADAATPQGALPLDGALHLAADLTAIIYERWAIQHEQHGRQEYADRDAGIAVFLRRFATDYAGIREMFGGQLRHVLANTPAPEVGAGYGTASTTDASQALRDEHQTATGEKG